MRELTSAGLIAVASFAFHGWATSASNLNKEQEEAVQQEVQQMVEYGVFAPVVRLTAELVRNSVDSFMFIVDKFAPDGAHVKTKARFVTAGYQDRDPSVADSTAPTVSMEVVNTTLNIGASMNYRMDVYDVKAAFL